ncbi:IPT/TIG domain-containing protein [Arthrobacter sp. SD76]|uniref:IPT/TIG domain-containing protein n=1 Tax=Arthrobacter sp. SD76 TaxID=3415007 RepID=UPI003C72D3C6
MKLLRTLVSVLALLSGGTAWIATPVHAATAIVTLSPDTGPAGTSVTVTGTGFPKKSSGTISAGTATAAFKTSASGYFTAELVMPPTDEPALAVRATSGAASAAATFTYTYSSPSVTEEDPTWRRPPPRLPRLRPRRPPSCGSAWAPREARSPPRNSTP